VKNIFLAVISVFIVFSIYYYKIANAERQLSEYFFITTHGLLFISLLFNFKLMKKIQSFHVKYMNDYYYEKKFIIPILIFVGLYLIFEFALLFTSQKQHDALCNSNLIGHVFFYSAILIILYNYIQIIKRFFHGFKFIFIVFIGVTLLGLITLIISK
jgi:hypothetical protein